MTDRLLEEELSVSQGLVQLYSKSSRKCSPGLLLIEPSYDRERHPIGEFRLILRNPINREKVTNLWSMVLTPQDVIRPGPAGQRYPRGELRLDTERRVAVVRIIGLRDEVIQEVPLSASSVRKEKG